MSKIAFIFPGQGAQYPGMGQEFYEQCEASKEIYEKASEICGMDMKALCFTENNHLNVTEYTQIAMLTTEIAMLKAVEATGLKPAVTAGLSLGEYGALVACHAMNFEDACRVVRQRGIFMQEAVPTGGAMAAVLGMDASIIEAVCQETQGIVSIANYNCPGQIVITGEAGAVSAACEALKTKGCKRTMMLNVSGPFHSKMLTHAGEQLGKVLEDVTFRNFDIPYVTNVTADFVTDPASIKGLLQTQVSASVRWQQSMELMIEKGVDTFIEIGPGKTLSGFTRKINRGVTMINIDKYKDLEQLEALKC